MASTSNDAAPSAHSGPAHFSTLAPGLSLPTDSQCAGWVRSSPMAEIRPGNRTFNETVGGSAGRLFPASDDVKANQEIAPRIDGDFKASTGEILRWVACKWGVDEDIVAAQAAVESWWRQTTLGDWGTDPAGCAPGHGLGADGVTGKCPQSFGILQNRYPFEQSTWPGIARSTAMNADTAYGIWRACFDGYELWLNDVEHVGSYGPGDAWGCVGRWYSGRWHNAAAEQYIAKVRDYVNHRVWEQPDFLGG